MYTECQALGCIRFQLPPSGALAGRVLQHASRALQTLIEKNRPLIFKVGVTHNAAWRWSSGLYGYNKDPDRWTGMVVLYISTETGGPAMLEAALIDKFQSNLLARIA